MTPILQRSRCEEDYIGRDEGGIKVLKEAAQLGEQKGLGTLEFKRRNHQFLEQNVWIASEHGFTNRCRNEGGSGIRAAVEQTLVGSDLLIPVP